MIALSWYLSFSVLVSATGRLIRLTKVKRLLDVITGVVLIGLGIKVAVESG